jgi:prepilin-type processing-associated H-X9-DG protein/prepilin-type N-terminal cleavage/methylation domain-containing protein
MYSSRKTGCDINNNFTLVELLVVIAVISVLAGMLLPALERARDSAMSILCLNNQKQIGIAENMYSNDFSGWCAPVWEGFPDADGNNWNQNITANGYLQEPQTGQETVFLCPSYAPEGWKHRSRSYGMWSTGSRPYRIGAGNVSAPVSGSYPAQTFGAASKFFYIADSVSVSNEEQWYAYYSSSTSATIHLRHNGMASLLFGDGHVASSDEGEVLNCEFTTFIPVY